MTKQVKLVRLTSCDYDFIVSTVGINLSKLPYRGKVTKFSSSDENFPRRKFSPAKISPDETFPQRNFSPTNILPGE